MSPAYTSFSGIFLWLRGADTVVLEYGVDVVRIHGYHRKSASHDAVYLCRSRGCELQVEKTMGTRETIGVP